MLEIGMGWMNMTEAEFWQTTPLAFFAKLRGWKEKENDRYRSDWERSRYLAVTILRAAGSSQKLKLPWDGGDIQAETSEEDFKKLALLAAENWGAKIPDALLIRDDDNDKGTRVLPDGIAAAQ